jgi:hypothetical protein
MNELPVTALWLIKSMFCIRTITADHDKNHATYNYLSPEQSWSYNVHQFHTYDFGICYQGSKWELHMVQTFL